MGTKNTPGRGDSKDCLLDAKKLGLGEAITGIKTMREKNGIRKEIFIGIIVIFFLLILFLWFSRAKIGQILVTSDPVIESDLIVVLMGSTYDRILQAADLYHDDYADRIVFIDSYIEARELAENRGVQVYGNALISQMAAMDLGISEEAILTLPGYARSTQDEALVIRNYLDKNQEINRLILVTSRSHSSRSKKIFQKAFQTLNRDIQIISIPSQYDSFDADHWWKDREGMKQVVLEYLKLIHFYFHEQYLLD